MKKTLTKRSLTADEVRECEALKAIYESKKKALGFSQESLGGAMGVSQGAVSQYLNATNALNLAAATKFAELLNVDISDFSPRLKKEAMGIVSVATKDSQLVIPHFFELPKGKQIQVKSFAQLLNKEQGTDTMTVFGELPDGAIGYRLEADYMHGLKGRCIEPGALLIVDESMSPVAGDIVIASLNGDPVIGHYARHAGAPILRPSNDQYDVIDISEATVIGVVVQWTVITTKT